MTTSCSVATCSRERHARGLCPTHYQRQRRTGSTRPDEPVRELEPQAEVCIIGGCTTAPIARSYCWMHYLRWYRNGDPADKGAFIVGDDQRRFWSKVDKRSSPDGCWLWTGGLNGGYGHFWVGGRKVYAHRYAWTVSGGGPIPEGFELDHLCRVTECVNPRHLEVVTKAENIRRSQAYRASVANQLRAELPALDGGAS